MTGCFRTGLRSASILVTDKSFVDLMGTDRALMTEAFFINLKIRGDTSVNLNV